MNNHYHDVLVQSTKEVFETMSFLDVVQQDEITENVEIQGIDLTAVVCLAGEISGMVAVHCSRALAEECYKIISGSEGEPTNAEVCDTVGELANMIAGTLKRHLSAHVDLFDLSLPSISLSQGQKLFYTGGKGDFPRLIVPFIVSAEQKFYVELLYHKR